MSNNEKTIGGGMHYLVRSVARIVILAFLLTGRSCPAALAEETAGASLLGLRLGQHIEQARNSLVSGLSLSSDADFELWQELKLLRFGKICGHVNFDGYSTIERVEFFACAFSGTAQKTMGQFVYDMLRNKFPIEGKHFSQKVVTMGGVATNFQHYYCNSRDEMVIVNTNGMNENVVLMARKKSDC